VCEVAAAISQGERRLGVTLLVPTAMLRVFKPTAVADILEVKICISVYIHIVI
jgi:hypothetical protein